MKYIIDIPETFKYTVEMGITQNGSIRSKAILNAVKDAIPYKERPHGEWIEHKWAEEFDGHLISNYECSCCHSWKRENTDFCPDCGNDMRKRGEAE